MNNRFNWNSMNSDEQARLKGISLHLLAQVGLENEIIN